MKQMDLPREREQMSHPLCDAKAFVQFLIMFICGLAGDRSIFCLHVCTNICIYSSSSERLGNRSCSPSPTSGHLLHNAGTLFDYTSDHWSCSGWLCPEGKPKTPRRFLSKGNWHSNCNNRRLVILNVFCMFSS